MPTHCFCLMCQIFYHLLVGDKSVFGFHAFIWRYMYMTLQGSLIFSAIIEEFLECQPLSGQYMGVPYREYGCFHHYWEVLKSTSLYRQQISMPIQGLLFFAIVRSVWEYVSSSKQHINSLLKGFLLFTSLQGGSQNLCIIWSTYRCVPIQGCCVSIVVVSLWICAKIGDFYSCHCREYLGICVIVRAISECAIIGASISLPLFFKVCANIGSLGVFYLY